MTGMDGGMSWARVRPWISGKILPQFRCYGHGLYSMGPFVRQGSTIILPFRRETIGPTSPGMAGQLDVLSTHPSAFLDNSLASKYSHRSVLTPRKFTYLKAITAIDEEDIREAGP